MALSGRVLSYAAAGLGIQLTWAVLLAFLPATLERLGAVPLLIGAVMAADPLTALVVLPLVGPWSDRARTRFGRRLPFLAVGAVLATLGLVGLSVAPTVWVAAMMATCVCLGLNTALGPYKAILADEFPPERHTATSAWQSLLREGGTLIAFGVGAWAHAKGAHWPFVLAAVGLGVTVLWTLASEGRRVTASSTPTGAPSAPAAWRDVPGLPLLMAAQAAWWFAIHAAKIFVVLFIVHEIAKVADVGSAAGQAATRDAVGLLAITGVTGIVASIPTGFAAARWGKAPVVMVGLAALLASFGLAGVATTMTQGYALAVLFGVGFATLQVLTLPLLVEAWPGDHQGAVASMSNLLLAVPQLAALLIMGGVVQLTGSYRAPFWVGTAAAAVAMALFVAYARGRARRKAIPAPMAEAA
jgi:maltose/moltooligosaccharide transporter